MPKAITYIDLFSGIGGFREGLSRAGGFACIGHCEIDKYADQSYQALFDTEGEWFCEDIRKADPKEMPDFDLLCGGFPCQSFSISGRRGGFKDPRGTLFFEIARLAAEKRPAYLLLENVPGLLSHDGGRTFAAILHTLDGLGYGLEWQVLNSKDFHVPQSRRRVYLIGYLDERCRGKVFPFTEAAETSLVQVLPGAQGERVYAPEGVSCTLSAQPGGFGGKTGLYAVGPSAESGLGNKHNATYAGANVRLADFKQNSLPISCEPCVPCFVDLNEDPKFTAYSRCLTAKQDSGLHRHKREASGVWDGRRIRRLTPRECLRLQGWRDERIEKVLPLHADTQLYKQAGNGVTVTVVEAIGKRLAAAHREVTAAD